MLQYESSHKTKANNVKYDDKTKKFNDASSTWRWQFQQIWIYLQWADTALSEQRSNAEVNHWIKEPYTQVTLQIKA